MRAYIKNNNNFIQCDIHKPELFKAPGNDDMAIKFCGVKDSEVALVLSTKEVKLLKAAIVKYEEEQSSKTTKTAIGGS